MKKITAEEFEAIAGRPPENDDLERVNCPKAGELLHMYCGYCATCGKPRILCVEHPLGPIRE